MVTRETGVQCKDGVRDLRHGANGVSVSGEGGPGGRAAGRSSAITHHHSPARARFPIATGVESSEGAP